MSILALILLGLMLWGIISCGLALLVGGAIDHANAERRRETYRRF